MTLTRRQLAPYVMEVGDLVATLLRRLDSLEEASRRWQEKRAALDAMELKAYYEFDREEFAQTLRAGTQEQGLFFDELEAFLAAWARLSLLFFPISGNDSCAGFRAARGEDLREALGIRDDSVLSDRELRDAWMHFDERLDRAIVEQTCGSRQRFIEAALAERYVAGTLRLLELDSLAVWFRSRGGDARQVDLKGFRECIRGLRDRVGTTALD